MARSDDAAEKAFPTFPKLADQAGLSPSIDGRLRETGGWRNKRKWAGVLLAGLIAGHMAWNVWASVTLNRELASVRAQGQPLRITEMAPPPVPDAQNAAVIYLEAGSALDLTNEEKSRLWAVSMTGHGSRGAAAYLYRDSRQIASDDALLARNRKAVALVRQAAAMPQCRFPIDYDAENLAAIPLKHLAVLRQLAGLMRIQAAAEARRSMTDDALDDVGTVFRMSDALAREPIVMSGLVSMVIQRVGYGALEDVLAASALTPPQAARALHLLPASDPGAMVIRDLQAERTFGLWAFGYVRARPWNAGSLSGSVAPNSAWPYRMLTRLAMVVWSPWMKMDEVYYLRHINETLKAAVRTPFTTLSEAQFGDGIASVPKYAVVARIMSPAFTNALTIRDRCLADRSLAEAAIALSAYRAANGRYPDQLETAAVASGMPVPADLYTGAPLRYRDGGDTFTLYSVGKDRKDDGGVAGKGNSARADDAGDIVWPGV